MSLDNTTALLILDVQNDTVSPGGAFTASGSADHAAAQNLIANINSVAVAARESHASVIHIHFVADPPIDSASYNAPLFEAVASSGGYLRDTWGADPAPGVEPVAGDLVLEKAKMSGFAGTGLGEHLDRLGVRRLVITGALTNMSVEHTARQAADDGYEVIVVSDATSTLNGEWQDAALSYALTFIAKILSAEQVVAVLRES